jgi:Zn-finger nucleic acid-binding protein
MNCNQCGAPMMVDQSQLYFHCNYCGSNLFPDPNQDGVILTDEDSAHPCPACKTALVSARFEGIPILSCPGCHGNLIDQGKLLLILRLAAPEKADCAEPLHPPERSEMQRKLCCPVCKGKMETYPYAGSVDMIIIQGCAHCRLIWLDFGELSKIIHSAPPLHERAWIELEEDGRGDQDEFTPRSGRSGEKRR